MESSSLFADFPPVSNEQWREKATQDLKGADFEKKLVWRTLEGFSLQPFYSAEDLNAPLVESMAALQKHTPERTLYATVYPSAADTMNKKALQALLEGATGVVFTVADATSFSFDAVLKDIDLTACSVSFTLPAPSAEFIQRYGAFLEKENVALDKVTGYCDSDVLETWSLTGTAPNLAALAAQVKAADTLPGFKALVVHSGSFLNAGSNTTQEIAFLLNKLVDYVDYFTQQGWQAQAVIDATLLQTAIGGDYFFEIAKLRTLRVVLAEIFQAYGVTNATLPILASSSLWSKSFYDPYVNMLRNTTEAMSAILGGCDALLIHPHNSGYEQPTDFTRRMALNITNLLDGESYFDQVADPAQGCYYLENLTQTLAEKALALFQEIEQAGGFIKAFEANVIQEKIAAVKALKEKEVATRKQVYVGVNQYSNTGEKSVVLPAPAADEVNGLKLLIPQRATQAFEQLRSRTKQYEESTGSLPQVYLACFGNLAMRKARATFALNFFAAAGFGVSPENYHADIQQALDTVLNSDAHMVVLCASDEDYGAQAVEFAQRFKTAGSDKTLVLAGYPADLVEALKAAGIDLFIHIKSNAIAELSSLQDKLLATV